MEYQTKIGSFFANERENSIELLGIPYAKANRFEYAALVKSYPDVFDATKPGDVCMQIRNYFPHYENPEREFYRREFRDNLEFHYSEDCLNLNIWMPKEKGNYPVVIWIHGGGFDSGANSESNIDGDEYAKRGIVFVAIQYRVGIFGYFSSSELQEKYGHSGNFGLDDQYKSILWVKENIENFYGDPNSITLMGQSAGAISIQYLSLSPLTKNLYQRAIMVSGGGLFPKFSLPRDSKSTYEYWNEVRALCQTDSFSDFIKLDTESLFSKIEEQKKRRKDNTYNTMPVIDGYLLPKPIDELIKTPHKIDYLLGFTNNDMYAYLMAKIAQKYAKENDAYLYFFDQDAKGDDNLAFHSSDLRFICGTLNKSWRPYIEEDYELSSQMIDYFANFIKTGNPNASHLPIWSKKRGQALHFKSGDVRMIKPKLGKLFHNMLTKKLK